MYRGIYAQNIVYNCIKYNEDRFEKIIIKITKILIYTYSAYIDRNDKFYYCKILNGEKKVKDIYPNDFIKIKF